MPEDVSSFVLLGRRVGKPSCGRPLEGGATDVVQRLNSALLSQLR
jgi:hypothetical protein